MPETHQPHRRINLGRILDHVAIWQFLCFIALIAFVWAAEVLDIKHLVYDTPQEPVDWLRASLLTSAILAVAAVTVGQTYLMEQRALRGFIIVCSYCRKVQVENEAWQQLEAYVSDKTEAEFSHGVCPGCFKRVAQEIEAMPGPKD